MARTRHKHLQQELRKKYPPSEPCACEICVQYCARPGWWSVEEAAHVIRAGYADRMMLEVSPEHTLAVISPAFKGNEKFFALELYAGNGCTFLENSRCQLFGTGLQPLECRFCHHTRVGLGPVCHADIEKDWDTPAGRSLVVEWLKMNELWKLRHLCQIAWLSELDTVWKEQVHG